MALESSLLPVPSEIVMPFSGYLASTGRFHLLLAATAGAIGCNIGSTFIYWLGATGGRAFAAGWDDRPAAYLAFGDTYATERAAAAERGWPTRTMPGRHLHMLVAPAAVVTQLESLLAEIGVSRPAHVAGGRPGPTPRANPTTTKRR